MSKTENVLADLYNGKITPYARARSEHYDDAYRHFKENYDAFCAKLPAELTEEFMELLDEHLNLANIDEEDDFIEGFKLGARIMEQLQEV